MARSICSKAVLGTGRRLGASPFRRIDGAAKRAYCAKAGFGGPASCLFPAFSPGRAGASFLNSPLVAGLAAKGRAHPQTLSPKRPFRGARDRESPGPSARSPGLSVNPRRLRSGALLFGLAPERMKCSQVLLRQPDLVAVSRPPDIASHAADEVPAAVVDFHERLFAFSATVGHCLRLAREAAASVCTPCAPFRHIDGGAKRA